MRIDINQKKISVRSKYTIFLNVKESFMASKDLFTWLSVINLFSIEENKTILSMKQKWSWFKTTYKIEYGNELLDFTTISFWKLHYQCKHQNDKYDIYGHRGRKYSIYKNDTQIAFWDKEAVSWFAGDNYIIVADDDADHQLLIGFCLILDNANSNDKDGATVRYDFGNLGWQAKEFNPNWIAK